MNYIKDSINLATGTIEEKRIEIKKQFLQTYQLDEKLFDLLKEPLADSHKKPII